MMCRVVTIKSNKISTNDSIQMPRITGGSSVFRAFRASGYRPEAGYR